MYTRRREKKIPGLVVGQLKTGEWVVFNAWDTPLWKMVFGTREQAESALAEFRGIDVTQSP